MLVGERVERFAGRGPSAGEEHDDEPHAPRSGWGHDARPPAGKRFVVRCEHVAPSLVWRGPRHLSSRARGAQSPTLRFLSGSEARRQCSLHKLLQRLRWQSASRWSCTDFGGGGRRARRRQCRQCPSRRPTVRSPFARLWKATFQILKPSPILRASTLCRAAATLCCTLGHMSGGRWIHCCIGTALPSPVMVWRWPLHG